LNAVAADYFAVYKKEIILKQRFQQISSLCQAQSEAEIIQQT